VGVGFHTDAIADMEIGDHLSETSITTLASSLRLLVL